MRNAFLLLLFFEVANVASALRSGKHCFDGCDLTLAYVTFNDTDPALPKKARTCQSVLHATSLYLCIDQYCGAEGRREWLAGVNETCWRTVNETIPPWSVTEEYTPDDVARLRRLRAEEGLWNARTPPLGEVVIPDEEFFGRAFRTLDYAYYEVDTHWAYGMAMFWFWGIVISVGICWRLASLIQGIRHQGWQLIPNNDSDVEDLGGLKDHRGISLPYTLLKRYIIIPAAFGYRSSQNIGWCTIPPRIQSLTIFLFVALNVVLCCISYPVFSGNLYWPIVSTQYWRYISDRTGVIALANFPLIWLFGTRNNVMMWLTGWGFGTFNNFHRWVARVATVQAIVHSIGYTEMVFERGDWGLFMKYMNKFYFWNGEIATILMVAISAFSVYGLRRCHYEVFLVTHILLSIIVLLTTFYHVQIFNGEYNIFIWPCLLVWIFDRFLRGIRILAFHRKFWNTKATVTYDATSNLVRLEIPCGKSLLKPQPGTYYYIYVLNEVLFMHQNHPFTLAYISHGKHNPNIITTNATSHSAQKNTSSSPPRRTSPGRTPSPESECLLPPRSRSPISTSSPSSVSSPSLVFLVRPYSGFTSRLRKRALSSPISGTPQPLRVLVEGPYGAPMSRSTLNRFPSILFIAGGTGIAVAISYLSALLSPSSERREGAETDNVTSIHIIWAVREHGILDLVLARDIPAEVLQDQRVRITVHVTQDAELKDDIAASRSGSLDLGVGPGGHVMGGENAEGDARAPPMHKNVKLKAERPDVSAAVEEAAFEAGAGGLAVVACGPAAMADDARTACVRALGSGCRGVEYFEESFKW